MDVLPCKGGGKESLIANVQLDDNKFTNEVFPLCDGKYSEYCEFPSTQKRHSYKSRGHSCNKSQRLLSISTGSR